MMREGRAAVADPTPSNASDGDTPQGTTNVCPALVETTRGLFRHVGSSRLAPVDLPHSGTVARCGQYVTVRRRGGTRRPYDGQRLRIVMISHESFPDSTRRPRPLDYAEVAVNWRASTLWFRLDELEVTP